MSLPLFIIKLEASAVPINRVSKIKRRLLFRHAGKEAFIVGQEFQVIYTITNIGIGPFFGGTLVITIEWPNGQGEISPYPIKRLNPGEQETITASWGILAPGFALFFARLETGPRYHRISGGREHVSFKTSPIYRDESNRILENVSFFSVFGQTSEEFYEYWAMIIAAIGFILLVLKDYLFPFFKWLWFLFKQYVL